MKVIGTWTIFLPLTFHCGDDFKGTSLTNTKFTIHDVECELLISANIDYFDRIKATIKGEYIDAFLPAFQNHKYMSEFVKNMSFEVGKSIQDFLDGFSKSRDYIYFRVFDGEDFTTKYEFDITPNICDGAYNGDENKKGVYLDDDVLSKSVIYANKEKDYLDNAWYYLRDAEYFIDVGKYEMAIINMATMLEFVIKFQLKDYLDYRGSFKSQIHKENIEKAYGNAGYPSFANKYYVYGLSLIVKIPLDEEVIMVVDSIYTARDKIAHGKRLHETGIIMKNEISAPDYRYALMDLFETCIIIYNYFYDLDKSVNTKD